MLTVLSGKNIRKRRILYILFFLIIFLGGKTLAAGKDVAFDKNTIYDIYYKVHDSEIHKVTNVKILGVVSVEQIDFLVVKTMDGNESYIQFSSIKAILPHGIVKPERMYIPE